MFRRLANGLLDIIYPKTCLACRNKIGVSSINNLVCMDCWKKIKRNMPPFCHSCGRHLAADNLYKNICKGCLRNRLHFDRAFSPCVYEGVIKNLIKEFKYKHKDYLGLPLSRLMSDFITEYNIPIEFFDFIIPIPLASARSREREFNQAEVLAGFIAERFNKELATDLLMKKESTKSQTDLEEGQRLVNVKGKFSVDPKIDLENKNILLVDDVLTSGATSSQASMALKNAGANIVFVLTLAN